MPTDSVLGQVVGIASVILGIDGWRYRQSRGLTKGRRSWQTLLGGHPGLPTLSACTTACRGTVFVGGFPAVFSRRSYGRLLCNRVRGAGMVVLSGGMEKIRALLMVLALAAVGNPWVPVFAGPKDAPRKPLPLVDCPSFMLQPKPECSQDPKICAEWANSRHACNLMSRHETSSTSARPQPSAKPPSTLTAEPDPGDDTGQPKSRSKD